MAGVFQRGRPNIPVNFALTWITPEQLVEDETYETISIASDQDTVLLPRQTWCLLNGVGQRDVQ